MWSVKPHVQYQQPSFHLLVSLGRHLLHAYMHTYLPEAVKQLEPRRRLIVDQVHVQGKLSSRVSYVDGLVHQHHLKHLSRMHTHTHINAHTHTAHTRHRYTQYINACRNALRRESERFY